MIPEGGIFININSAIDFLKKEYGYNLNLSAYFAAVDGWKKWYSGTDDSFHKVVINNGLTVTEREMYRLYMAKKVAEDWANLLLNEKTRITLEHKHSSNILQGEDEKGGILAENDFWPNMSRMVEQTFALGTGAAVLRLENADIGDGGELLYSPDAKIRIDWLSADNIIPLSWQQDKITDAAFVSEVVTDGGRFTYLQLHRLISGEYIITSHFFKEDGFGLTERPLPEGVAKTVRTGNRTPWFTVFRPNIVNNLFPELPTGVSVFAGCKDILKGIDLCYDSLNMEFYLGKKMVFLRKDLLSSDDEGMLYAPQDSNRQLFMYVGDKTLDGDMIPKEFNPTLRVEAHTAALQQQLNYLAGKCGFGENHYRFDGASVATATQVISENSNLFRSVKKHEILLERQLISFMREILTVARDFIGRRVIPDCKMSVTFDDSVIEDTASMQKRDLALLEAGVMQKWEFRRKYFGEDEKTAKKIVEQAEKERK